MKGTRIFLVGMVLLYLAFLWPVSFYGRSFTQITPNTNRYIWFAANEPAYSLNLSATGRDPVISARNNKLSFAFSGGVFTQHKAKQERTLL